MNPVALLFLADLLGFCTSVQLPETVSLVRLTICFRTLDADPSNPLFDLVNYIATQNLTISGSFFFRVIKVIYIHYEKY